LAASDSEGKPTTSIKPVINDSAELATNCDGSAIGELSRFITEPFLAIGRASSHLSPAAAVAADINLGTGTAK
jgi:hypothetical protein